MSLAKQADPVLILPMAGTGNRFKEAGYETLKPFIEIFDGEPQAKMIDFAVKPFPDEMQKFLLVDENNLSADQLQVLREFPNTEVINVGFHKNGPAYSIYLAREQLPSAPYVVTYCDIFWEWDYEQFSQHFERDALILTHYGFHPHLFQNNFSAFCRVDEATGRVTEVKEKSSFTDNWMEEPVSVGCFYVKDSEGFKKILSQQIENQERVAGEFYPSESFNYLINRNLDVFEFQVPFYVHWGTPEVYGDVRHNVRKQRQGQPETVVDSANIVVMGGQGKRMTSRSKLPKALIPVPPGNQPMFQRSIDFFNCQKNIIITTEAVAQQLDKELRHQVVCLPKQTASQFDSIAEAANIFRESQRFFLTSCDAFGVFDNEQFAQLIADEENDAVVFGFEPTHLQKKQSSAYSSISFQGTAVQEIHIKKCPQHALGLAGFFWFKDGSSFAELSRIPQSTENEMCADHIVQHMVREGKRVRVLPLDFYYHLGTPEELEEHIFWQRNNAFLLTPTQKR